MDSQLTVVILLVIVALAFDYINGFHDAANSIANGRLDARALAGGRRSCGPPSSTSWRRSGSAPRWPRRSDRGMIDIHAVTFAVIFAGLVGAIAWDLLTWWLGLPTSSSHALIGGYAGAAVTRAGFSVIIPSGWDEDADLHRRLADGGPGGRPRADGGNLLDLLESHAGALWTSGFRRLQLLSAALFSLNHGANDAQKTMGIIAGVLFTAGYLSGPFYVPYWVVLAAHAAIGLGTLSGGWRIIHTMGSRITKLQPGARVRGRKPGAASAILLATHFGIPVSTTHAITGAIVGVGATRRWSAVRWGVAGQIMWAWLLTIPGAAAISAANVLVHSVLRLVVGSRVGRVTVDRGAARQPAPFSRPRGTRRGVAHGVHAWLTDAS